MRTVLAFWCTVLGAVLLAVLGTTPPRPRDEAAPAHAFSAQRAMAFVHPIARAPHPSGSRELAALGRLLDVQLTHLGFAVRRQEGAFAPAEVARLNARSGEERAQVPLVNLIAVKPGRDPSLPALALMAHYDSVFASPGAADDGAGVATILETARALRGDGTHLRTLYVILTDGEEVNLSGARAFFGGAPEAERIGAVINLEARGGGGRTQFFQASPGNGEVARVWARHARSPAGTSLATFIYTLLPNDTDLTIALEHGGYAAWNFAFVGRPGLYHSPAAKAYNLDQGALQQMGDQTLGLARALLDAPELPAAAPDRVFFDVFGLFVLDYAPVWGWAMLALALVGFVAPLTRAGGGKSVLAAFWGGLWRMLALILGTALVLKGLNLVSGAGEGSNYYDRLAAIPLLQLMAACTGIAGILALLWRKPDTPAGLAGLGLPLLVLAIVGQVLAPVAAYLVVIPVLFFGIGLLLRRFAPGVLVTGFQAIAGALVAGYAIVVGYSLLQAVGPVLPEVAALPIALVALALAPLRVPPETGRIVQAVAVALLVAALGLALWVRLDPIASMIPPYSDARAAIGHGAQARAGWPTGRLHQGLETRPAMMS